MANQETLIVITNPYYSNSINTVDASSTEVRVGIKFYPYDSTLPNGYDSNNLIYEILDYQIQTSNNENILELSGNDELTTTFPSDLETILLFLDRKSIVRFKNEINAFSPSVIQIRAWSSNGTVLTSDSNNNQITNSIDYTGSVLALGIEDPDDNINPPVYYFTLLANICLHSDSNVLLEDGVMKNVKDLQRGDMVMTDEGPKPLSKLVKSTTNKTRFVKIAQGAFGENIPNCDVYLTPEHPLGVFKEKTEKGNKYTHLSLKELANNMSGITYEDKETENVYNLIFDDHYVVNVGGLKVLSHHPNHDNYKVKLQEHEEMNHEERSQLPYVDTEKKYFNFITFKQIMGLKPEDMKGSEHVRNTVKF